MYYTNILEDGGTVDGREGGDNGDDDDVGKVAPKTVLNVDTWKLPKALGPDEELQAERQQIKEKNAAIRVAFRMNPAPPELKEEELLAELDGLEIELFDSKGGARRYLRKVRGGTRNAHF